MSFRLLALSLVSILLVFAAHAEDVPRAFFTADKSSVLIGESLQLTLTVEVPLQSQVVLPQFRQHWPPFTLTHIGNVSTRTENNMTVYSQVLSAVAWQPGNYQTPEIIVSYTLAGGNSTSQIMVQPVVVAVPSVLSNDDLALRPLKPPVPLPYTPPWLIGFIALVLLVLAGGLMRYVILRTRPQRVDPASLPQEAQAALRELKRIGENAQIPAQVFIQGADCIRVYLRGRFQIDADDMTTVEINAALLKRSHLSERQQRELQNLLERSDLVKFAAIQPKSDSAQQFVITAQRWIRAVERISEGGMV